MNNPRVDISEKEYLRLIDRDNRINDLVKYLEDKITLYDNDIKQSQQWLDVEEMHQSVKADMHKSKCIKKELEIILERLKSDNYEQKN